jgi:multiple antibiotic resistance protein
MLAQAIGAFLLAFPALFSIINPPGGAIIFNEVTSPFGHKQQVALARRVAVYSTFVMLGALLLGAYVLSFFGISLNALRIAGGIVVSARAYEMLSTPDNTAARKQREAQPVEAAAPQNLGGFAFFPLTLPFTTGPGTIAVAISLGTERPNGLAELGAFYAGAAVAVLAMSLTIWACYSAADRLAAFLGETGRVAVARLAAFLLLGIGVQIALNGIVPVLHAAMHGALGS